MIEDELIVAGEATRVWRQSEEDPALLLAEVQAALATHSEFGRRQAE